MLRRARSLRNETENTRKAGAGSDIDATVTSAVETCGDSVMASSAAAGGGVGGATGGGLAAGGGNGAAVLATATGLPACARSSTRTACA